MSGDTLPRFTFPVQYFPELIVTDTESPLTLYNRVSSDKQAGTQDVDLHRKTQTSIDELNQLAPGRLAAVFQGTEEGKFSLPRPTFYKALADARQRGAILVASDLSRFLRSEGYDSETDRKVSPTRAELDQLRRTAGAVVLSSISSPFLSESKRQSFLIKRSGRAGRPRVLSNDTLPLVSSIMYELGPCYVNDKGEYVYTQASLHDVEERSPVSRRTIRRWIDTKSPYADLGAVNWKLRTFL
jgi:hypothetical protein